MNSVLAERLAENIHRLALGIEPVDAARGSRVAHSVELALENVPQPAWRWRPLRPGSEVSDILAGVERHDSCRYVLRYRPGLSSPVDLRIFDRSRRFAPRRLRVPIHGAAELLAEPPVALAGRVRRPVLYPGAAYDICETSTGIRGRILRGGVPMRWARIEARLGAEVVGRAHGDDRGDFLLLIALPRTHVGGVADPLPVVVTVFGPDVAPAPSRPDLPQLDGLWDLPLEVLGLPGAPDPTSAGDVPPTGYRLSNVDPRVHVDLPLGRMSSAAIAPFQFT